MWSKKTFVPLVTVPFVGVVPGGGFGFETHSVSLIASYGRLNAGSEVGHGVEADGLCPTFAFALGVFTARLLFEFALFLLS